MQRAFQRWLATLDPSLYELAREGVGWYTATAAAVCVIVVAGVLPGTRDFFELRAGPALLCLLPVVALNVAFGIAARAGRTTFALYGAGLWLTAVCMIFFAGALVSLSGREGAMVMAAILLFVASFYGNVLRASIENPVGLAPIFVGLAAGLGLNPGADHLAVYGVAGPAALGGYLVLGQVGLDSQRNQRHHEAMRAAVQAQVLDERGRDVSRLNDAILRILQNNHDAGNALSSALLNSELLVKAVAAGSEHEPESARFKDLAEELRESLLRLRSLVDDTRVLGMGHHEGVAAVEEVPLAATLRRVVSEASRRHPEVELRVDVDETVRVQSSGGEDVLHRILENVVLNACEGDGRRHARHVWIESGPVADGRLPLRIADDGPGFSAEQLAAPVQAFETTKPYGSGVGLYVVERLVRASRGELERGIRPGGGGQVEIRLRVRGRPE